MILTEFVFRYLTNAIGLARSRQARAAGSIIEFIPRSVSLLLAVVTLAICSGSSHAAVSFETEVEAILSKVGCNAGTCHGNASGKGGFKLSLRGQDPDHDYRALTRELFGRRVNPIEADQSLILLKATLQIPHEGGKRFEPDSIYYSILKEWIGRGAPRRIDNEPNAVALKVTPNESIVFGLNNSLTLKVEAEFADGTTRDVTRFTAFEASNPSLDCSLEGTVRFNDYGETTLIARYLNLQRPVRFACMPERENFTWNPPAINNYIDEEIFAKLKTLKILPSPACSDREFLRRSYLDLLGLPPKAEEAKAFLSDESAAKRSELIDRLLKRPEYADHWALKWADLLRLEERALDRKGVFAFHRWIRDGIDRNVPMDEFVRNLLTARGSTYNNPAANFFRANREPRMRAEAIGQLFLGVKLQCAQCHNHPFDRWTQDDYYDWTSILAPVDYKILENRRRDSNDKHEFKGEQIVWMKRDDDFKNPKRGEPAKPRFLGTETPLPEASDRMEALANWITRDNRLFAQAQANRVWYHLMGRGMVDPIDDFRSTNPASHPALLERLADDFIGSGFDLKHLIRAIMNSNAYQLSSTPNETNRGDSLNYSHNLPRRLHAETLLDALSQAVGAPLPFNGYPTGMRAGEIPGIRAVRLRRKSPAGGDQFLTIFGKPPRLLATENERTCSTTMKQAFTLISGPAVHYLLTQENNRIGELLASDRTRAESIEELYWAALSRPPSGEEIQKLEQYLAAASNPRAALEDICWGLVNSKAFLFRL